MDGGIEDHHDIGRDRTGSLCNYAKLMMVKMLHRMAENFLAKFLEFSVNAMNYCGKPSISGNACIID